jgi:two-component system sensor histidine kinase BaeS
MRARIRSSLRAKLLLGQLLVIVAGSVTLALVALAVAPGRFNAHVRDRLGIVPEDVAHHLDEAFGEAVLVSLAVAVAAALLTALGVSVLLAVRIVRPVTDLAATADRIAAGAYGARAPATGSDELAVLARSFNAMAASLETTEGRRRELIADLEHELRTPLATIEGYVEGLADGVIPADQSTWRVLQTETRRLGRLVADLQEVSRAEERQLDVRARPTAPADLVDAAIAGAAPRYAAGGVQLQTEVESRLPELAVDPDRIGEVLANLLDNALRHTPPDGRVTLSGRRHGRVVELAVTDTGAGLTTGELARVFERFYRGDPARAHTADGGTGLGLTIARAIVEAHGGTLRAESGGRGRGSRFVVALPLRPPR